MPLTRLTPRSAGQPAVIFITIVLLLVASIGSEASEVLQEANPYGEIDATQTSVSVLRRSIGVNGSPGAIESLDRFDPPDIERLLEATLRHPNPAMRSKAGVALAKRGEAPAGILARMDSVESVDSFVIGTLGSESLERKDAIAMLEGGVSLPVISRATLHALASRKTDATALAAIVDDSSSPFLARGIAATALERTSPGTVEAWLESMGSDPEVSEPLRDRSTFATIETAKWLGLQEGIEAIEFNLRNRPSNDGLRAAAVLALLRIAPDQGLVAWEELAGSSGESKTMIPIALLLIAGDGEAPAETGDQLPRGDPLQDAIRQLALAAPADRPDASVAAIRRGHLPTMRWFLELPDDRKPIEVLDAIMERGTTQRRSAMVKVLIETSTAMARLDPERLAPRLELAISAGEPALAEILLRGLLEAGTREASATAALALEAPLRNVRSLALLAVVEGTDIDPPSIRRLGQIAAGGGALPDDLRPLAAWQHLRLTGALDESLPKILAP